MKKRYTKKQIQEAINYWEKQLKLGNYKKVNESRYDTDMAAETYAQDEEEISAIAAQLMRLPKNDMQEAAYNKIGDLALANAKYSNGSYTKAEQLVYDFNPVVADDFQNGIEFGKSKDDKKWQAKLVLAAICKCPAKTVDEYDEWLQQFMPD